MVSRRGDDKINDLVRIVQRFLVPQIITSLYLSLKYRSLIHPKAEVQLTRKIRFGRNVKVKPMVKITTSEGEISIGEGTFINSMTSISIRNCPIHIGKYVQVGSFVSIAASNHVFDDPDKNIIDQGYSGKGIAIEDDVWIGSNCVVLDGVKVGKGSVIGAGSIVTKDIPPLSVAVGNPAEVISSRK